MTPQQKALLAARNNGIGSILFRNSMGKKLGISLTESLCMTLLGINGNSTPSELAREIGLSTGAITTLLDRLERRRIIRRKPNPEDRRGVIVEIHEEYAKAAGQMVAGIQRAHQELIAKYSDEELEVIADFLNRFTEAMQLESAKIDASEIE